MSEGMERETTRVKQAPCELYVPSEDEAWDARVLREVELIGYGILGIKQAAVDAVTEHPEQTAEKLMVSLGLGVAMAYFSPARGLLGLATRVGGAAMGLSFMSDVDGNGKQIVDALSDNWRSSHNWQRNVAIMEDSVGRFGFDTVLMTVGGIGGHQFGSKLLAGGARAGLKSARFSKGDDCLQINLCLGKGAAVEPIYEAAAKFSDAQTIAIPHFAPGAFGVAEPTFLMAERSSALGKLYLNSQPAIVRITGTNKTEVGMGTGFFIDDSGMLLTNNHVISGYDKISIETGSGTRYHVRVLSRDRTADVALLQVLGKPGALHFQSLKLAPDSALSKGSFVASVGHPGTVPCEVLSLGQYKEFALESEQRLPTTLTAANKTPRAGDLITTIPVKGGSSGSPLLSENGDVVGIVKARRGEGSLSTAVEHLQLLIRETRMRQPVVGWLDVMTAFDRSPGQLRAFTVTISEKNSWPVDANSQSAAERRPYLRIENDNP